MYATPPSSKKPWDSSLNKITSNQNPGAPPAIVAQPFMNKLCKLNEEATGIFCQLFARLRRSQDAKTYGDLTIHLDPFLPLVIKELYGIIETPWGEASRCSISQISYKYGNRMREPEMTFLVVDYRQDPEEYNLIGIYPEAYNMDKLALYQKCLDAEYRRLTKYIPTLCHKLAAQANDWLINLKYQGFLGTEWKMVEYATLEVQR
jgi:hypothetical protein